jgi:tetratricopeptide (TPR) repeat protein
VGQGAQLTAPDGQPQAGVARGQWLPLVTSAILLAGVTLAVYWQVLGHEFVNYDDYSYVTRNPQLQGGFSAGSIAWALQTTTCANWHPLTWLSLLLDYRLYGLRPGGYHLTNLLFHIANALLLAWVLFRMTGSIWRSGFVAALFAVHPLHVESVAWVAERKDVLSTFFWLLTMLAYIRYTEQARLRRYLLVVAALALGLMAKPMLVSLPIVLLLLDWWPLKRLSLKGVKPLIVEKIPLAALAAISCVVTVVAQAKGGALRSTEMMPLAMRLENAVVAYLKYFIMTVRPSGLAVHYTYVRDLPVWHVAAALVFLIAVSCLVVALRREHRYLAVGWLWYVIALVPVIGLVQVGGQPVADRYTYVPLIGIFVMGAWGVPEFTRRVVPWALQAVRVLAVAIVLACAAGTWRQVGYWQNSEVLWRRAVSLGAKTDVAYHNYGAALQERGQYGEAIAQYTEMLRINPQYEAGLQNLELAYYSWGSALEKHGKLDEALSNYHKALEIDPTIARTHNSLGILLARRGSLDEAVRAYGKALQLEPDYAEAHSNLGNALIRQGKLAEGILQQREALRLDPKSADAHNNLGCALAQENKIDEAISNWEQAVTLKPDHAEAHDNLASAYLLKGKYAEAWKEIGLCRRYGGTPDAQTVAELSQKMQEPGK